MLGAPCCPRDSEESSLAPQFKGISSSALSFLPVAQMVKNLPAIQETQVQYLGWEYPLEKGMVTHSSIVVWRIPWAEELQLMGSQRVRHD